MDHIKYGIKHHGGNNHRRGDVMSPNTRVCLSVLLRSPTPRRRPDGSDLPYSGTTRRTFCPFVVASNVSVPVIAYVATVDIHFLTSLSLFSCLEVNTVREKNKTATTQLVTLPRTREVRTRYSVKSDGQKINACVQKTSP